MELIDISRMSIEDLDKISTVPEVVSEEIIYDSIEYEDLNGIRSFKKPMKIDFIILIANTIDIVSLVQEIEADDMYVFAMSLTEDANVKLGDLYYADGIHKGYCLYNGASSDEISCIR